MPCQQSNNLRRGGFMSLGRLLVPANSSKAFREWCMQVACLLSTQMCLREESFVAAHGSTSHRAMTLAFMLVLDYCYIDRATS
jgi:hypothetical protein